MENSAQAFRHLKKILTKITDRVTTSQPYEMASNQSILKHLLIQGFQSSDVKMD